MLTLASPILLADSDHWHGPGWWVIFPIFWLLFLGAIVWFCVFGRRRGLPDGRRPARGVAARRALSPPARSTEQEYRERLAVLREKR